ncbi:hypothetical protein Amet_3544 [Alkaliphilus metalliredigens QYMF]|uniref:Uncharacterized protein n=1 Tax=Alkaliphilus metalliredigens (strain QYMF) TaxID=293826 RepID=A6TU02_ALKMQ|nr:hypothetical protein [Alkaliphilus metalliredigens]ABR49670.1 hypothetical protein Amet_3544 [Alkaliphilus metalliredigens QYMF]
MAQKNRIKCNFESQGILKNSYFNYFELELGDRFIGIVANIDQMSEVITLELKNKKIALGYKIAQYLFIELDEE